MKTQEKLPLLEELQQLINKTSTPDDISKHINKFSVEKRVLIVQAYHLYYSNYWGEDSYNFNNNLIDTYGYDTFVSLHDAAKMIIRHTNY